MHKLINSKRDPVVISAWGAVTPLGSEFGEIATALRDGQSGIKKIEKFDCSTFVTEHAGVPIEGNEKIRWPGAKHRSAEILYADLASKRLKGHCQFPKGIYSDEKIGCLLGVDEPAGDIELCVSMKKRQLENPTKARLLQEMNNIYRLKDCFNLVPTGALESVSSNISFEGISSTHVGLCSASLQAIGRGMQEIKAGRIDAAIVGGVSGKVNPINLARLELMDVISTDIHRDSTARSRPFDKARSGFVPAEGAVLFMIERASSVRARGDKPLLELRGYGSSMGAEHIVAPHRESLEMRLAMQRAINSSGIDNDQIQLVNAHATSTILNDFHESRAINDVLGFRDDLLVTGNKSLHGHLIAAAGAMEVLNTLISLNSGFIPGTINCDDKDSRCEVNIVKNTINKAVDYVLKNSFGMGGLAASMVLGRIN